MTLPDNLPPLPPVPDGYSRWEYRGRAWVSPQPCHYAFIRHDGSEWLFPFPVEHGSIGYDNFHYIEAVREPAKDQPASGEAEGPPQALLDYCREMRIQASKLSPDDRALALKRALEMVKPPTGVEARVCGWQPIETVPRTSDYSFCRIAWMGGGEWHTGDGMRHGEQWFASGLFYRGGPHDQRQYEFREIEVRPSHWKEHSQPPEGGAK